MSAYRTTASRRSMAIVVGTGVAISMLLFFGVKSIGNALGLTQPTTSDARKIERAWKKVDAAPLQRFVDQFDATAHEAMICPASSCGVSAILLVVSVPVKHGQDSLLAIKSVREKIGAALAHGAIYGSQKKSAQVGRRSDGGDTSWQTIEFPGQGIFADNWARGYVTDSRIFLSIVGVPSGRLQTAKRLLSEVVDSTFARADARLKSSLPTRQQR